MKSTKWLVVFEILFKIAIIAYLIFVLEAIVVTWIHIRYDSTDVVELRRMHQTFLKISWFTAAVSSVLAFATAILTPRKTVPQEHLARFKTDRTVSVILFIITYLLMLLYFVIAWPGFAD